MGSYQDGIFKFIIKIPENFPDGDCPVSVIILKVNANMTPVIRHPVYLKAVFISDNLFLACSETNVFIHPPSL